jgi:hypothetical protein
MLGTKLWNTRVYDAPEPDLSRPMDSNALSKPKQSSAIVLNKFNTLLIFKDPNDEQLYDAALRDMFYFPTFIPIIVVYIAFGFIYGNRGDLARAMQNGWALVVCWFISFLCAFILVVSFTLAQAVEYLETKRPVPRFFSRLASFVLRRVINGRNADAIILSSAFANGFEFTVVSLGNLCTSCKNTFSVELCVENSPHIFPWQKVFFAYTVQLILPIFLKSSHRYVSFLAMFIITAFMVISLAVGDYEYTHQLVFMIIAFHISMFEFERYRMTTFLMSKEALNYEKIRQEKTKADADMQLERRMNQALLQQILPAPVAKQLLSGKKVDPEQFEEVTIFFSDVVGFTNICAAVTPIEVVKMLNELYTVMDYCTSHFPLYKVETIGDAYMVRILQNSIHACGCLLLFLFYEFGFILYFFIV